MKIPPWLGAALSLLAASAGAIPPAAADQAPLIVVRKAMRARLEALDDALAARRVDSDYANLSAVLSEIAAESNTYQALDQAAGDAALAKRIELEAEGARRDRGSADFLTKARTVRDLVVRLLGIAPERDAIPRALRPAISVGAARRKIQNVLACAGAFDGGACPSRGAGGSVVAAADPAAYHRAALVSRRQALDQARVPPAAPGPDRAEACREAIDGGDAAHPQHPKLAGICQDHPFFAPILAGMLDALQAQFGLAGLASTLLFSLFGLVISTLTGGVALILKLAMLVAVSWTLWTSLRALAQALDDCRRSRDGSRARYGALRRISAVSSGILISVAMALVGYELGKTRAASEMTGSLESGMNFALNKLGISKAAAAVNGLIPQSVTSVLSRVTNMESAESALSGEGDPVAAAPDVSRPVSGARPVRIVTGYSNASNDGQRRRN